MGYYLRELVNLRKEKIFARCNKGDNQWNAKNSNRDSGSS